MISSSSSCSLVAVPVLPKLCLVMFFCFVIFLDPFLSDLSSKKPHYKGFDFRVTVKKPVYIQYLR